ncbi:ice-binding family protein [Pontibacter anaerobius]|uniref:Ice-binding family protein n=1 Tax=Pontibacter anaerobius TaxID=2993940 RepID=A0ABT3RH16_9BACT|nr:ice-binding family protein [Pontibacter anaerobius]MCX2740668.1 ice-binding family protein [Pontibacter anaerobius]
MRSWLEKVILLLVCFCVMAAGAFAQTAPALGALYEFGAVASSGISNTGNTVVQAKVGAHPGKVTGFQPTGTGVAIQGVHEGPLAKQAVEDARAAMAFLAAQPRTSTIAAGEISGMTITPGVHAIDGNAILNGNNKLIFDGQNKTNPVFIIKVSGTFDITKAEYELLNKAASINLFWVVGGDVTVRKSASALGNIFSGGNIVMEDGAQIQGRLVAPSTGSKGQITFTNNSVTYPADLEVTLSKEPGSKGEDTYAFGEQITYYITVKNNGPTNAENVKIFGANLAGAVLSYSSSRPGVTFDNLTWFIGGMDYKSEVTLTVTAKIEKAGIITSTAAVAGSGVDEVRGNNLSTLSFCVLLSETGEIKGPAEVCLGDEFVYSIDPVEGATSYAWSVPSGWSYTQLGTMGASTSIKVKVGSEPIVDNAGFVKVTASNTCGEGPARTLDITVQAAVPPQAGPISGPDGLCLATTEATFSVAPVANATSYNWTLPNGWSFISGQGTNVIVVKTGGSGTITVEAVNACGVSEPQTKYVQVDDATPSPPSEILGTVQGCVGNTVPFEVADAANVTNYSWTVPAGWEIVEGQGTHKILVKVGSSSGNVTVRASNGCGTSEPTSKPVAPVSSVSAAPGPIAGDVNSCINRNGLEYSIEAVPTATKYEWSVPAGWEIVSGQGTTKITVNTNANGGDVTVVAWNDCGPSEESKLTVVPVEDVPLQPGPISGVQYGCVGGTATYSIDETAGANSYNWTVPAGWTITSGQGTTSIDVTTGSNGGKVTVSAVNGCGTGAASTLDVVPQTQPPLPPAPISGPGEVCEGQAGYEFSVPQLAGVNTYTWTVPTGWVITAGQGTSKITVTAGETAGEVTVKGENDCGAGTAAAVNVTVVPSPPDQPGDINGPPSVCVGQKQVTYTIEPVAFASNYIWSVGDGSNGWSIVSGQGTTSIVVNAGSTPTIISVKAENACGITGETQLTTIMTDDVPEMPGPISGNTVTCAGGTYTFSIDAVKDAYKYNWSFPAGWEVLEDNGTTISVKTNGTGGTVSVTAQNGCGPGAAQTLQVTPTNTAPATPEAILGNVDVCANTEAVFSVKEVNGASSYTWKVPTGWTIVSGQGTPSITVMVGTTAGAISVTSKNDCGDSGTISRNLILNTAPPATPGEISGSQQVCTSTTTTYTIAPVNTAYNYTWSVPEGWEILSGQGSESIEVRIGTTAGEVTVVADNSCGESGVAKLAVDVAENTPIKPGAIAGPAASFCEGTPGLTYSIEPVNGAVSYTWAVPTGWAITAGQGTTSITVTSGSEAGEVTVTVANACGSEGREAMNVMAQTAPLKPEISMGPVNPCQGVTTTYSVSASATGNVDTYIWEVPTGWQIVSGHNTNTIEVIANGTSGKIKVTAKNSCSESGTAEMEVVPSPALPSTPSAITGTPEMCAGSTVTYSVQNPEAGASYEWTVPEGWEIVSGQGKASITVVAGAGVGTVTVKGVNGCGSTDPASLEVTAMPEEGVTSIKDVSSPCVGLSYEVEPVPGATDYVWSVPAGWTITSGQGTTKISVTAGFGNGDISVVAKNGGCTDAPVYFTPSPTMANSELHFPNVFSPNNDGTHDVWEIRNLTNYPDSEVTIINRWGNQVYHSKAYKNNWNGDNLSEGTYFYVVRVKLCDGQDKMFKGYVMIVR